MIRVGWAIGGFLALILGALGIFLPLLPTVPFLLLAAFCFARSSERLHSWLVNHAKFGPPIQSWQARGAIGKNAKIAATVSVIAAFSISLALSIPDRVLAIQILILSAVMLFIWTRPED